MAPIQQRIALVILFLLMPFALSGDGIDDEDWELFSPVLPQRDEPSTSGSGRFYAQFYYRDDLLEADAFAATVKTYPASGTWPGSHTASDNRILETRVSTIIRIRGVSVPQYNLDRTVPSVRVDLERKRFDDATDYLWKHLSEAEYIILESPGPDNNSTAIICDVFIPIVGQETDVSQMMIHAGHAKPAGKWNWGTVHVEPTR